MVVRSFVIVIYYHDCDTTWSLNKDDLPLAQLPGDIPWKDYRTMDKNTTQDLDDDWQLKQLAKVGGAQIKSEGSGEDESVSKYTSMKEALLQVMVFNMKPVCVNSNIKLAIKKECSPDDKCLWVLIICV